MSPLAAYPFMWTLFRIRCLFVAPECQHEKGAPMRRLVFVTVWCLANAAMCQTAWAQCSFEWRPGEGVAATDGSVRAITVWDPDGPGPAPELLVVGGEFRVAGHVIFFAAIMAFAFFTYAKVTATPVGSPNSTTTMVPMFRAGIATLRKGSNDNGARNRTGGDADR